MADLAPSGLSKIRSDALRRDVLADHGAAITVVVEVALPRPTFTRANEPLDGDRRTARLQMTGPDLDPSDSAARFLLARREIESLMGKPVACVLESAASVVVDATGEQIRRLANLACVMALWANDLEAAP